MAALDKLPNELLYILASHIAAHTHARGIFSKLIRVNRRLRDVFEPLLWRLDNELLFSTGHTGCSIYAVCWAAEKGRIDILEKAFKYQSPLGSASLSDPISRAAEEGQDGALGWLLDHGVPTENTIPASRTRDIAAFKGTPLYYALRADQTSTAIILLSRGANPRFGPDDIPSDTALHVAVSQNLEAVVRYLVQTIGMDVNSLNDKRETPLHCAVKCGRRNMVETLLHLGANVNDESSHLLPLTLAISTEHLDIALLLLRYGSIVAPTSMSETTISPLMACASYRRKTDSFFWGSKQECVVLQKELLEKLIENGANVNERFGEHTPLISAIRVGTPIAVDELIKGGADMQIPSRSTNWTLFAYVCSLWREDFVAKTVSLLLAGGRLDAPCKPDGSTPLEEAIRLAHRGITLYLKTFLDLAGPENVSDRYIDELFQQCLVHRYLRPGEILMRYGASSKGAKEAAYCWAKEIIDGDSDSGVGVPSIADLEEDDLDYLEEPEDLRYEALSFCLDFQLSNDQLEILFSSALHARDGELCHLLIDRGLSLPPKEREPWLHQAVRGDSLSLIRRLCRAGMDINGLNDDMETPLLVALQIGRRDIANLLFNLGADPFHPRPGDDCRLSQHLSHQVISPFEFAIRYDLRSYVRRWWSDTASASRPTEEFYIPLVLAHGGFYKEYIAFLRDPSRMDLDDAAMFSSREQEIYEVERIERLREKARLCADYPSRENEPRNVSVGWFG